VNKYQHKGIVTKLPLPKGNKNIIVTLPDTSKTKPVVKPLKKGGSIKKKK
jgi:hypothetical protein